MDGAHVASSSSSSTAPTTGGWTYDAFLSFRGEDTRNNFVDHLYAALDQAGLYTFKDDERLQKGKSIAPELVKAIEESMVSVVVFSKNYANSSWCLEELVKIMECRDNMGQRVLPVFYDVDPSDVREQKGSFQTAFQQHEVKFIDDVEKVKRWREALKTAANLSGWDVTASGREAECIKQIVRTIVSYAGSRPDENLIGMESWIRHVKSLLGKGDDNVCFIGIWGMGGTGKTTIQSLKREDHDAVDKESLLSEIQSLKREALDKKRAGNTAEALALLKKAKLLEANAGGTNDVSLSKPKLALDHKPAPKRKMEILRELLTLKKKALALKREGKVDEADQELMKGKALEQRLEELESGPKVNTPKVKPTSMNHIDLSAPVIDVVNKSETAEPEEQIKAEKVKAVQLKRAGKQAEALDALRRAKVLEKKLNSLA